MTTKINYAAYGIKLPEHQHKLDKHYDGDLKRFREDIKSNPYHVLIGICGMSFKYADTIIMRFKHVAPDSYYRCQYAVYDVLKNNELAGNTRMTDTELAEDVCGLAGETMRHVVTVVCGDPLIHYEPKRHLVAFEQTYKDELLIADHLISRVMRSQGTVSDLANDVEKYRTTPNSDVELTDEQMLALCMVKNSDVCMINGSAGCVDADTEFFTGHRWKRIADYEHGDKVLQYNENGTAELVEPMAYIKQPCDYLWHFETLRGTNQTVCDNHRIIYETRDGVLKECNIHQLMDMHLPNGKSFQGRFLTTFNYGGSGIDMDEWHIRLMVAAMADSTMLGNGTYCRFNLKKERKKERLIWLLKKCNEPYTRTDKPDGYSQILTHVPRREKIFTKYWYNCSTEQLRIILDEVIYWDGCVRKTQNGATYTSFSTSIKESADFIQFAASACGIRASISTSDKRGEVRKVGDKEYVRKSLLYVVHFSSRTKVGLCSDNRSKCTKTPIEHTPSTDGYKYCFTVPSHMLVLRRKDSIFITGNCGKSQTTSSILNMLDDIGASYQCLTPTGVSSKILKQYTGRPAMTIHMFLTGAWQPDYIIIDEASMCSVHLLAMLLSQVGYGPKLVFIADNAQLASIQCGSLVQDMIDSGIIPRVELTKIFRYNSSGIVTMATDIRHGNCDHLRGNFSDYLFIDEDEDSPVGQVVEQYDRLIAEGYGVDDIVVLCPFNKRVGADAINAAISAKYNPNKPVRKNSVLKLGDKVLNTKNNYQGGVDDMIANGDIGYLRNVAYSRKTKSTNVMVEFDDGVKNVGSLMRLKQAYSTSIHRAQGSSAKAVIVLIDTSHEFMLSANLLYVAVTRARERLVIVGNSNAITNGIKVQQNTMRNTWLKEMLEE